ncbi:MAG: hypothetical protein RL266_1499 [Bacteroidota bacterium]
MFKHPVSATIVALILALIVNVYYFSTGDDLAIVVSRTLFADTLLVLTLVPIYESIRLRDSKVAYELIDRIKSGMKAVTLYTFAIGIITFVLFKLFGEPLVADRIHQLTIALEEAIASGSITEAQQKQQLEVANQVYSATSQVLMVLLANLFVGFVSSILAAMLIRK